MRIKIDEETCVEIMQDGLAVTGREIGGPRHHTVMVPMNDAAREAIKDINRITQASYSSDKLDGMVMPERGQVWRHYKGTAYEVMGVVEHSESNEMLVLYREVVPLRRGAPIEGDENKVWARPLLMWHDEVGDGGPRFKFAGDGR